MLPCPKFLQKAEKCVIFALPERCWEGCALERKKLRGFVWDYALSETLYSVGTATVIVKLTEYFDMPLALSNLIAGLPGTMMFLELLGGYAYRRTASRGRYLRRLGVCWRLCLPLVLLTAFLPKGVGPWVFLALYTAMCTCFRMSKPAYSAWMVWTAQDDGNFYSDREMAYMPLYTAALFLSGLLIDRFLSGGKIRQGFGVMALAELALAAGSLVFLLLRMTPPREAPARRESFRQSVLEPLHDTGYRKVLRINVVWNFSAVFISTFASVYQIRVLGIPYLTVTLWATLGNLARSCFVPVFSRFARGFGWKPATMLSVGMLAVSDLLWIMISPGNVGVVFPMVNLFSCIPMAAFGIGLFNYQIQYTREETRSSYFSVSSALSGLAAAAGTFLCSGLVSLLEWGFENPPYRTVFLVGMTGTLATLWLIRGTPYTEQIPCACAEKRHGGRAKA